MSDLETRARKLIEREDLAAEEREKREQKEADGSRLTDARERIRRHDADLAAEQARREAAREDADLAVRRRELEDRIEAQALTLRASLEELADLHGRHLDAKRRAGRELGSGFASRLQTVLEAWFKGVFGGGGSLVGLPHEQAGQNVPDRGYRTLAERDPLASTRTNPDG